MFTTERPESDARLLELMEGIGPDEPPEELDTVPLEVERWLACREVHLDPFSPAPNPKPFEAGWTTPLASYSVCLSAAASASSAVGDE